MEQHTPKNQNLSTKNAPDAATHAVLKPSAPVAAGARIVRGLEFNDFGSKTLTVEDLVENMSGMGFQATAVAEAVRIVNDMVCLRIHDQLALRTTTELIKTREHGEMPKHALAPPYF